MAEKILRTMSKGPKPFGFGPSLFLVLRLVGLQANHSL
jgi:hypothetical protein